MSKPEAIALAAPKKDDPELDKQVEKFIKKYVYGCYRDEAATDIDKMFAHIRLNR